MTWQRGIKVADEIKVASHRTLKKEIILDYPNGPSVSREVLKSERWRQKRSESDVWTRSIHSTWEPVRTSGPIPNLLNQTLPWSREAQEI